MKNILLALVLCASLPVWAKDRRELVNGTYRIFPAILKLLQHGSEYKTLSADQQRILDAVCEKAANASIPLLFNPTASDFNLNDGEAERLMRTPINSDGTIEVNESLLSREDLVVDPPFLLKTFFHELSHKVGPFERNATDAMAQWVEERTSRWTRTSALDDGRQVTVFSVPFAQVDRNTANLEQVQPTFLLFLEDGLHIQDLTPVMIDRFQERSNLIRSIWSEINRVMFKTVQPLLAVMSHVMTPLMGLVQMFGGGVPDPEILANFAKQKIDEIRVIELQGLDSSPLGEQATLLRLKATYTITRTDKTSLPIDITGFGFSDTFPVPLTFELILPRDPQVPIQTEVTMRPSMDFSQTATVASITRDTQGRVALIKVDFLAKRKFAQAHLMSSFGGGYFLIPAKSLTSGPNGTLRAEFEIPWTYYGWDRPLLADSILLDSDQSLFLNRIVELNAPKTNTILTSENQAIIRPELGLREGSLGLWGRKDRKPLFMNDFQFREPLAMLDHMNSSEKSIDATNLRLDFELTQDVKVKEVRLHFTRTTAILDTKPDPNEPGSGGKIFDAPWGESSFKMASGGNLIVKKDTHEILTAGPGQIFRAETAAGTHKFSAVLNAQFIPLRDFESPTEAYRPPAITPWMVEIVTDQGFTYRHYFGMTKQTANCEEALVL